MNQFRKKIRVLVVDDSVVARRLVKDAIAGDPVVEIADIAATGRIALAKIPMLQPDIVTLDIQMPDMNGLETLAEIRKSYPSLPVIMFSHMTENGAEATLDALSLGANDYVTKPQNVQNRDEALLRVREELLPKIKAFCPTTASSPPSMETPSPSLAFPRNLKPPPRPIFTGDRKIESVVIGISTGGPNALAEMIPFFSKDFPVPILIVQHMPPIFTRFLAERLSSKSALRVMEAAAGDKVSPGDVFIAPGDFHMKVERDGVSVAIKLTQDSPENSCRPSVDVLFTSAAQVYGSNVLGVIMTGMGHDGLRGCENIVSAGGLILAQDQASSVVWGMPGFVSNAGLADKVLPLAGLGPEILRRVVDSRRGGLH